MIDEAEIKELYRIDKQSAVVRIRFLEALLYDAMHCLDNDFVPGPKFAGLWQRYTNLTGLHEGDEFYTICGQEIGATWWCVLPWNIASGLKLVENVPRNHERLEGEIDEYDDGDEL